jgi:hypothetical protein
MLVHHPFVYCRFRHLIANTNSPFQSYSPCYIHLESIYSLISLFRKIKVGFWDHYHHPLRRQLMNASVNPYRTLYVYYGTCAHLNCVLHKSFPLVCVSVWVSPPIVARQRPGKNVTAATNTQATIEELLDSSFPMRSVSFQMNVCDSFLREFFVSYI